MRRLISEVPGTQIFAGAGLEHRLPHCPGPGRWRLNC